MNHTTFQQTNSSMTDSDIKYYLRKLDFPACAREALVAIGKRLCLYIYFFIHFHLL